MLCYGCNASKYLRLHKPSWEKDSPTATCEDCFDPEFDGGGSFEKLKLVDAANSDREK